MLLRRREVMKMMAAGVLAAVVNPATLALANKAAISISAPHSAAKGSEVTITLQITHNANNFTHFVNWVYLKADDQEIGRWDFSSFNRPEHNDFTREIKIPIEQTTRLVAEANCIIHGSEGLAQHTITVEST